MSVMIRASIWMLFFIGLFVFFVGKGTLHALTLYKYTDKNGTVCFVEDPNQVPLDCRENVKKIELKERKDSDQKTGDRESQKESPAGKEDVKEKIADLKDKGRELKEMGERQIARGFELVFSFFQDQRPLLIGYLVGGVILFLIVSVILKKYLNNFVIRLFIKMVLVIMLFAVGYLYYISYMSQNLRFFDQELTNYTGSERQEEPHRLVTPRQIIDRAKDVADEMNRRIKQSEEMMKE